MAWISVHEQVKDHPKTREFSKLLPCSRHEAIGILVCLWLWGISNADREGVIISATEQDIAYGIMYLGQSPEHLVDCLVRSKWLDYDMERQKYSLHDWDIWQDQWYKAIDKREANALRMRENRAQKGNRAGNSAPHSMMHKEAHVQALPLPNRNPTVTVTSPEEESDKANALCPIVSSNGDEVQAIIVFLNHTLGSSYRASSKKTKEHINARLREGFTVDDFKAVILKKYAEWGKDPKMSAYLRPETLFGTKFEGYLNQPEPVAKNSFLDIARKESTGL